MSKIENGFRDELSLLIRARYPLILVDTYEESRLERILSDFCVERRKTFFKWSFSTGLQQIVDTGATEGKGLQEPVEVLESIIKTMLPDGHQGQVYWLKDFHHHWENPYILRLLRDFAHMGQTYKINIVFSAPSSSIPADLQKDMHLLHMDFPEEEQIREAIKKIQDAAQVKSMLDTSLTAEEMDALIKACKGLTLPEVTNALNKCLTKHHKFDVMTVVDEKSQIVKKTGILTFVDTSKIGEVGGLENLKEWVYKRQAGFTEAAENFGLPPPKGAMLFGIQGCGKSLASKKLAQWWSLPLYRLDMSKVMGSLVGESERNMSLALDVAESTAPCILWIDECEKALSGIQSSGASDSGTTARVIQSLLTWMEEHHSAVFVIMTANNVDQLPPELTREGRIDVSFFIDLPNIKEREEIIAIHIAQKRRKNQTQVRTADNFDIDALAMKTEGFTGSQLQQLVINSLWDAFNQGKELDQIILEENIANIIPFAVSKKDTVEKIKGWAEGKSINASKPYTPKKKKTEIAIEVE